MVEMHPLLSRRMVLVTGKGGVGRSVVAAALAKVGASLGRNTLLAEFGDDDHAPSPLAALFHHRHFGVHPQTLDKHLQACRLKAAYGQELFLRHYLPGGVLFGAAMRSKALQHFLSTAPSFVEMGWFYHAITLLRERTHMGAPRYEFVVLDMPATGHTLALTGLPEILARLMSKGPIAQVVREGMSYLNDPTHTTALIVTLPEALPVSEALELVEGLVNTKVDVGAIALNRFPEDPFSENERRLITELLSKQPAIGQRAFARPVTAGHVERRLRASTNLPIVKLHDIRSQTDGFIDTVANRLSQAICPRQGEPT
jgi:anion-transporting  ArsA/GET3 family ATPase